MSTVTSLVQAQSLHRANKLTEATAAYEHLLSNPIHRADALYGLGTIHHQQKNFPQAITLLKQAIAIEPAVAEFHFNLGLAYRSNMQHESAKVSLMQAISFSAQDNSMVFLVCNVLLEMNEAELVLRLLQDHDDDSLECTKIKARCYIYQNKFAAALPLVKMIAQKCPDHPSSQYDLAQVAARLRNFPLAVKAYDKFLELSNGGDFAQKFAQLDLLLQARKVEDALALYDQLSKSIPSSPQYLVLFAQCCWLQNQLDAAIDLLQRAINMDPSNGFAWRMLIDIAPTPSLQKLLSQLEALSKINHPQQEILVAFAHARALHRLKDHQNAYKTYCHANQLQSKRLSDEGKGYDRNLTEDRFLSIRQRFAHVHYTHDDCQLDQPIFITGMPRSGTSLLEKILGGLEGTRMMGELETIEHIATRFYWETEQGTQTVPQQMPSSAWSELAHSYRAANGYKGVRTIDKMPHNFRHLGLIAKMFPGSSLIYIERDPIDSCWSIFTKPFPDDHNYACDMENLSHYYGQHQKLMKFWKNEISDRLIWVKYEELVSDPITIMKHITDRCNLTWNNACLDIANRLSTSFTFSEMQIRQPISTKGIGKWRQYKPYIKPFIEALTRNGILIADI